MLTDQKKEFNYYDKEVDDKYIIELGDILISWSAALGVFEWKREKAGRITLLSAWVTVAFIAKRY